MQRHEYSFEVEATPGEIWAVFLHPGDQTGDGLVRHCHFRLPRYLLEHRVHRFISKDNDQLMKAAVEGGVKAMRKRATG